MISSLVYTSKNCIPLDQNNIGQDRFAIEMRKINAMANVKNRRLGITGFLFYFDQQFVQILEGEFDAVSHVFSGIRRDQRHKDLQLLWFQDVDSRVFSDWSMDFSMNLAARDPAHLSTKAHFLQRYLNDFAPKPVMRDFLLAISSDLQAHA